MRTDVLTLLADTGADRAAADAAADDVRSFISEHRGADGSFPADWNRRLAAAGYVTPHWPRPWGRDASPVEQLVIDAALRAALVPKPINPIGIGWAGPTLLVAGTPQQHERYLPGLLDGSELWCQLFSEPGAGSDLASLTTRAERDGDTYVVNGQKIWTTLAHVSRYGILLARTDPDAEPHRGISYFVVDMQTPGVDVRPIRQMNGRSDFNEVFLTDVRVPAENLVGDEHDGWRLAKVTLGNERVSLSGEGALWGLGPTADTLLDIVRAEAPERTLTRERDALIAERDLGESPPVVFVTHEVLGGNADVGEEHLVEVGATVHLADGPDIDARGLHVDDEVGDAAVRLRVGVGARQQDAVAGDVGERRPDLLAVHDVGVAVTLGSCGQRREVAPRARLTEELAPQLGPVEQSGEVPLVLLWRPGDEQRRPGPPDPARGGLIRDQCGPQRRVDHELFDRARVPSPRSRPVGCDVAGCGQPTVPVGRKRAVGTAVLRDEAPHVVRGGICGGAVGARVGQQCQDIGPHGAKLWEERRDGHPTM